MDLTRADRVAAFITQLPYCKALDLELLDLGPGHAELALPYRADLIGDPASGTLHGGPVSALMDTACSAAVLAHPRAGPGAATLDLRIDYMRSAAPGQTVRAEADCVHITRSVAFVRATAWDDDPDLPIATAAGTFSVAGAEAGQ